MTLQVGDIVTIGRACLANPEGARAIVVEAYELSGRPGWMLLFENGAADGFSPGDCELFKVALVGHEPRMAGYRFTNTLALGRDWRGGVFQCVWPAGVRS